MPRRGTPILLPVAFFCWFTWTISADKLGRWLQKAAWTNNLPGTKLLISLGTDVSYSDGSGTALHCAAYQGNTEMIALQLQQAPTLTNAPRAVPPRAKFSVLSLVNSGIISLIGAAVIIGGRGAGMEALASLLPLLVFGGGGL